MRFDYTEAALLTSLVDGSVEQLEIVRSEIFHNAATIISGFLQTNKTLQELEFSQNTISGEDMEQILKAIQTNTTLQKLDISSNNIPDKKVTSISECLARNSTIKELKLSWKNTIIEGITKIAKAIAVNKGLHTLDLSSQHIDDPIHFTMTLFAAMKHNHTLMRVVLPANVNKIEAIIKSELNEINEERRKKDADTLVLDIKAT